MSILIPNSDVKIDLAAFFAELRALLPDVITALGPGEEVLAVRIDRVLSAAGAGLAQTAQVLEAGAIAGVSGQLAGILPALSEYEFTSYFKDGKLRFGLEKKG